MNKVDDSEQYIEFRKAQNKHFRQLTDNKGPLFTTDAQEQNLFSVFLGSLPIELRQHYDCRCCKTFFERYGSLVHVTEGGDQIPAMWPVFLDVPPLFRLAVEIIHNIVRSAKITGVHVSSDSVWGTPENTPKSGPYVGKTWHHIHVVPGQNLITRPRYRVTCEQVAAEKVQEFEMLERAFDEFKPAHALSASLIAKHSGLDRSEKVEDKLAWFHTTAQALADAKNPRKKRALLWLQVAGLPTGWAHIKNGVAGTILEDVKAGLDPERIKAKFNKKVAATTYMRPTAAPSAGQIDAAEREFRTMGLESALARRYATLADIEAVWKPYVAPKVENESKGIFSALIARPPSDLLRGRSLGDKGRMTWEKFRAVYLSDAKLVEMLCPGHGNYFAMLTATDKDAKPLLWWDRDQIEDARNPVNYYVQTNGSFASAWNLSARYVRVNAIMLDPCTWLGMGFHTNTPKHVFFALEGARPTVTANSLCLFPEDLRKELHAYRKTIEAYSKTRQPTGKEEASACGYMTPSKDEWPNINLRVTMHDGSNYTVRLDRWD